MPRMQNALTYGLLQSRRLECRLRTPKMAGVEPKKEYVHMLNATLTATERTLCCLLETYQTPEGFRYSLCWTLSQAAAVYGIPVPCALARTVQVAPR